ncbi:MAG: response regulator transcription factor [Acidobacteria bacterium]|nr:response regulator transcription factor [Acidobacteriota bacterium]
MSEARRLLVVEDDPQLSGFLVKGLREERFAVDLAEDGEAATEKGLAGGYDAILLDHILSKKDGFDVCRELRDGGVDAPILMLTARDEDPRGPGPRRGADDYLAKPFSFEELLPRLRALLECGSGRAGAARGPGATDPLGLPALRETLNASEYRLLEAFVRRPGEILTSEELGRSVWGRVYDPDSNAVSVTVVRLRAKLEAAGSRALPRTVPGLGYVLKEPAP